jgi:hypothetical protein
MPKSKHGRKGLTTRQWRKRRSNRISNAKSAKALEKRGIRRAMKVMSEQMESGDLKLPTIDEAKAMVEQMKNEKK